MTFTHTEYDFELDYPKLVRDNIQKIMESKGQNGEFRISQGDELINLALKKLVEESKEAAFAKNSEELTMELADVLEILEAIAKYCNISMDEILRIKEEKRIKNGGFEDRLILVSKK